jgi:hypothetical protein
MPTPATVTTGEDWTIPVQLLENSVPVDLTGLTITAAILSPSGTLVVGPVDADPDHALADLAHGLAILEFPRADTDAALSSGALVPGSALLEVVRVNGATQDTWQRQILWVVKGAIP